MNITLAPELEQIISQKVVSDLYASANDVIREALRLLAEQDGQLVLRLEELRKEINLGLAQLKNAEAFRVNRCLKKSANSVSNAARQSPPRNHPSFEEPARHPSDAQLKYRLN